MKTENKIQPLHDYVLLKEVKEETKGGIYVPEGADTEEARKASVLRLGSEVEIKIKTGDIVLFKPYGFDEIVLDGERFLLGREENICAILT